MTVTSVLIIKYSQGTSQRLIIRGKSFWRGDYFKIYGNVQQKGLELCNEKFRKETFKHSV